ncbi:MAG: HD domain-containing protein [Flavobacteriaceae bacterium]|nr:HD domain-containing protein [Flavobacteriaceae bacterium]
MQTTTNKLKIFNDPIYGFITIPDSLIFDVIEHPIFQRLRRIQQMGLSSMVYPGAQHTRFHHALGCLHLMQKAIQTLRSKGIEISTKEEQALHLAILLHDIGHGPFSHALEQYIIEDQSHEDLSLALMNKLNLEFGGQLDVAIQIFTNQYPRKFLFQLISSQLDMDRLDYLKRDSFYTGVVEGSINSDRLIAMLHVKDDQLVVEEKGIYSIEKFLLSRRFMYWQVYLHKTGLLAEQILIKALQRAAELASYGENIPMGKSLQFFIDKSNSTQTDLEVVLDRFIDLDDIDIWNAIKTWQYHDDFVLSELSKSIILRKLPRIELSEQKFTDEYLKALHTSTLQVFGVDESNLDYFLFQGKVKNRTYNAKYGPINILLKDGSVKEWLAFDGHFNSVSFTEPVVKYFVSYPKSLKL